MDNKYQNGKIYQLVDIGYTMCYIGSTYVPLSRRMCRHRAHYTAFKNHKNNANRMTSYESFDKFGVENCKIELLENYPCNSKEELLAREGYWIRNTQCVNKLVQGRTQAEYMQGWADSNKDKLREYKKAWHLSNLQDIREKSKKYREEHHEEKLQRDKEYRERNKAELYAYAAVRVQCECGCTVRRGELHRHRKTQKHQQALNKEPEPESQ